MNNATTFDQGMLRKWQFRIDASSGSLRRFFTCQKTLTLLEILTAPHIPHALNLEETHGSLTISMRSSKGLKTTKKAIACCTRQGSLGFCNILLCCGGIFRITSMAPLSLYPTSHDPCRSARRRPAHLCTPFCTVIRAFFLLPLLVFYNRGTFGATPFATD